MDVRSSLLRYVSIENRSSICNSVLFYDAIESTQETAIFLAESNSKLEKALIVANEQRQGMGRSGKVWMSPYGGIWFSLIVRPKVASYKSSLLTLIASLSVCDAIRSETGLDSKIKWPNDIVINSKKVSGILTSIGVENTKLKYAILGVGLNSNLDDKSLNLMNKSVGSDYEITSLKRELSDKWTDSGSLLISILQKIGDYHGMLEIDELQFLDKWKTRCETINKHIRVVNKDESQYEGLASDVASDGSLIIKIANGEIIRVSESDVTILVLAK
jgi:biotin-[acetyl-CoA-carboxylase] ligase BirA-like protein